MKIQIKNLYGMLFIPLLLIANSCKKFVEIPPPINQLTSETVFGNDATAIATLNGIYSKMMSSSVGLFSSGASLYPAMSADELSYFTSTTRDGFIQNTLSPNNEAELRTNFWVPAYNLIYAANSCIEGTRNSPALSAPAKDMVVGEALFIRSFCYFYLINLFGDVPLVLGSDYQVNKGLGRVNASIIYAQIKEDLLTSEQLLLDSYPSAGRNRPNKATVRALLSKIYLFQNNWAEALKTCDLVISDSRYSLPSDLASVFLSNSTEAIWQLAPVLPNYNTFIGNLVVQTSASAAPTYLMTDYMFNAFEPGDKRKSSWVQVRSYQGKTFGIPFKYKIKTGATVTESNMVFRLAELYLMRAEAKAHLNDLDGAKADLYKVRFRAALGNFPASISKPDLLLAILQERRIELFSEWGNRWFDLKRTQNATAVLGLIKPLWKSTAVLYPIPYDQLIINPELTQNEGY